MWLGNEITPGFVSPSRYVTTVYVEYAVYIYTKPDAKYTRSGSGGLRICGSGVLSISGLVVKSIVAIDGPRVRFAADAFLRIGFFFFFSSYGLRRWIDVLYIHIFRVHMYGMLWYIYMLG